MFELTEMYEKLVTLGSDWADKKSAYELLSETRKSLLAELALEFLANAKTLGKARLMAENSKRYIDHVQAEIEAGKQANLAKVNYDAAKTYIDLHRTRESTRRAEIQKFGG